MSHLPTIRLGLYDVTRLIIGGNPLCGNSHFSPELSQEMAEYFTAERVVKTLQEAQAKGINTIQARADYHRVLYWMELFRRQGGKLHWIAQHASEMHDIFQNIKLTAAAGAAAIYHHGTVTDNLWLTGKMDKVKDALKCMRDTGVLVGLATHIPDVLRYVEDKAWDVDFYMACFYNISVTVRESALTKAKGHFQDEVFDHDDRELMCRAIMEVEKPCLAFKILGANRLCQNQDQVRQAFRFAFSNIKPTDAVVVGMYPRHIDQIGLNIKYALEAITESAQH